MSINKSIKLGWDGKEYVIKINMEIIDAIEEEIDLVKLLKSVANGRPKYGQIAKLFTVLLNAAGAEVETDNVFHALFGAGELEADAMTLALTEILGAIFPNPKKKPITRSPAKAKKKAVKGKT